MAKDNKFFESRKYAKEADQYNQSQRNQFIERNLQSGIVRSAKDGAISKLESAYDTITDNPLDTGKAVAENLWLGAKDCLSQPIDCLVNVVDDIWTVGKSAAVETYHNVKGTDQESINNIYGEDVSSDMLAVSGLQLAGVAVETLGAGKALKVGGKATVDGIGKAILNPKMKLLNNDDIVDILPCLKAGEDVNISLLINKLAYDK